MKITLRPEIEASDYLTNVLKDKLEQGKKVLWFATGGSSIKIASEVSKQLSDPLGNLTVMLTDERYGPVSHKDSNWQGLINAGFELSGAHQIPILSDKNIEETAADFSQKIKEELDEADYKIGLFGIGADGHTAGLLPGSLAVDSEELATSYHTEEFDRVTMTPKAIARLDEAIVFMEGKAKWPVIRDLLEKEKDIREQPAQVLKQVSKLTIFSDYKK